MARWLLVLGLWLGLLGWVYGEGQEEPEDVLPSILATWEQNKANKVLEERLKSKLNEDLLCSFEDCSALLLPYALASNMLCFKDAMGRWPKEGWEETFLKEAPKYKDKIVEILSGQNGFVPLNKGTLEDNLYLYTLLIENLVIEQDGAFYRPPVCTGEKDWVSLDEGFSAQVCARPAILFLEIVKELDLFYSYRDKPAEDLNDFQMYPIHACRSNPYTVVGPQPEDE